MAKVVGSKKQQRFVTTPGGGLGRALSRAEQSFAQLTEHLASSSDSAGTAPDGAAQKLARRDALKHAAERAAAKRAAAGAAANPGQQTAKAPPAGSRAQAGRLVKPGTRKPSQAKK